MDKFITQIVKLLIVGAVAIGGGVALKDMTFDMAKAAIKAHQQNQMSYSKFTRALVSATPKKAQKN